MRRSVIWDLDGTLFDSYDVIVESIRLALRESNICMPVEEIRKHALQFSIKSLFAQLAVQHGINADVLHDRYGQISRGKYLDIKPMPNAMSVLEGLNSRNIEQYIFTHRGRTTIPVLENLNMKDYFREILTSQSGFARKPDPQALHYLMGKYELDPGCVYYVGDRSQDMECAVKAGIWGILYAPDTGIVQATGFETYVVTDLMEIMDII